MKIYKNIFIYLVLFFYFTSSLISSTHIHHKKLLTQQSECKVCLVVKNINSANALDISQIDIVCSHCYDIPFYSGYFVTLFLDKGFNSNAPPLS